MLLIFGQFFSLIVAQLCTPCKVAGATAKQLDYLQLCPGMHCNNVHTYVDIQYKYCKQCNKLFCRISDSCSAVAYHVSVKQEVKKILKFALQWPMNNGRINLSAQ